MKKQILWDWNGTLLDDRDYCIAVRNRSFPPLGLRGVDSLEQYYREFTFPIRQYYQNAGVDDEHFVEAAHAWSREYDRLFASVPLFADAKRVLNLFRQAGLRQVLLSASKLDSLREQVDSFGIGWYFDEMLGLSNIYAHSKEAIGRCYMDSCGISPRDTLMIGDSLHDAEVAKALGVDCLLVCRGHQSRKTLETAGFPVWENLDQVGEIVLQG